MGMLGIFVGKVLQLLRESDAADGESGTFHWGRQADPDACRRRGLRRLFERASLCGADRLGVKVALSVDGYGLLNGGADGGVHVVGRQSSSDGTQARHRHLEELRVVLLLGHRFERRQHAHRTWL